MGKHIKALVVATTIFALAGAQSPAGADPARGGEGAAHGATVSLGGDIFHGALTLNQLFSARPMLGHADYRGPLKGLYHCGSGAHPGGGVTGAPGHNAARAILGDHRALFK